MAHLSAVDRDYLQKLREKNILADVDAHLLNQKDGVIMIACSDGDQMPDVFKKQSELILDQCENPRIHVLALNGGALVVPNDSPLNQEINNAEVLLKNLEGAIELKKIHTLILYAHAPCGAAGLFNLDVNSVIEALVKSKEIIKQRFTGLKVACFFHVDWGDHKRTYFISASKWKNYNL